MNSPACNIRDEIRRDGPIPFARFMELALYAPGCGYYERAREIGRRGDFFTSVSVGPVFGELLAFQFAAWLDAIPRASEDKLQIIEAGAHDGRLALDILSWLRKARPELFTGIEYHIIEPSPARRAWQEKTLADVQSNIRWFDDICSLAPRGVSGIIFSNELLDAMPVHRLTWSASDHRWMELRVDLDGNEFSWCKSAVPNVLSPFLPIVPRELASVLPDGFTTEISPAAIQWWQHAASALRHGKLLTIDYGLEADEWLRPERASGTLRAYAAHRATADVLANPGAQDLTAHINFSALAEAGEGSGLRAESLVRQSKFLTDIFGRTQYVGAAFDAWTRSRVKQFQTLTHPEHLGERFRVLIQSREQAAL